MRMRTPWMRPRWVAVLAAAALLTGCAERAAVKEEPLPVTLETRSFGTTPAGEAVTLSCLKNANGMEIAVTNYGATLTSVKVPDAKGQAADVALGFDSLEGYTAHTAI
ncbi:MAG: hypothetical protein U5J83_11810, partial [Bryobacterales bacterium]|nr:hypothetical protein [Bryobacterales bacterium]